MCPQVVLQKRQKQEKNTIFQSKCLTLQRALLKHSKIFTRSLIYINSYNGSPIIKFRVAFSVTFV